MLVRRFWFGLRLRLKAKLLSQTLKIGKINILIFKIFNIIRQCGTLVNLTIWTHFTKNLFHLNPLLNRTHRSDILSIKKQSFLYDHSFK